ncbi:hypothetical protein Asi02nite_72930 [Asanoa siamensis]|uniref:Uncharacterized protein n=1 Tax=Asanoa siamensis TaxID=926357 RepID=A0ABQ4D2L2_9ACTN|nr:hypothetical protein Asi02nite_72930 [Asanoa siamensis]
MGYGRWASQRRPSRRRKPRREIGGQPCTPNQDHEPVAPRSAAGVAIKRAGPLTTRRAGTDGRCPRRVARRRAGLLGVGLGRSASGWADAGRAGPGREASRWVASRWVASGRVASGRVGWCRGCAALPAPRPGLRHRGKRWAAPGGAGPNRAGFRRAGVHATLEALGRARWRQCGRLPRPTGLLPAVWGAAPCRAGVCRAAGGLRTVPGCALPGPTGDNETGPPDARP